MVAAVGADTMKTDCNGLVAFDGMDWVVNLHIGVMVVADVGMVETMIRDYDYIGAYVKDVAAQQHYDEVVAQRFYAEASEVGADLESLGNSRGCIHPQLDSVVAGEL